ncbi:MAG: helix-turn-helix domain-containing protein, partial [Candidatus Limnocylindria bacterium]
MSNRISRASESAAAARRLRAELGSELREARLGRGLRLVDTARAAGISVSVMSRVERGLVREPGISQLARYGTAVGLRLHARFYPMGGGLRDAAQLDLLRRLRARIGDRWSWQLEAPLAIPGDLRAFDAVLTGTGVSIAIEAITRLRDAQAQLRQAA